MLPTDVVEQRVGLVEVQGVQEEDEDVDKSLEETLCVLAILGADEVV